MKRFGRILGILGLILLVVLLVGPLVYPIPPLEGTAPPRELADPDSQFVTVEGIDFHYKSAGEGGPAFVLLHGFGASVFSWREVMDPLGERGQTLAFDRPAFGLTERPMPGEWSGESPYSLQSQVDQTVGLMDAWGLDRAILVGHSAGGRTAVLAALEHPERVAGLVLVAPAVGVGGGPFGWLGPLLRTPQLRRLGPYLARSIAKEGVDILYRAWHDTSQITDEILDGYTEPLKAQNWDRAYYELVAAGGDVDVTGRLDELAMPILIITGDDDQIVPTVGSIELAAQLPAAELVVVPDCGHLPHEERPGAFMDAVGAWLETMGEGFEG